MRKWHTTEGAATVAGMATEGAGGKMGKYAATRAQHKIRRSLYDDVDYNDYEQMLRLSGVPIIGGIYKARAEQLEYEENLQWWSDYAKNTGISLDDIKYPIRAGLYRGYVNPAAATIAATESVMSLYGSNKLMRWL